MTTARQIKKLLAPIAAKHSDVVVAGPALFLRPVRHVSRMVLIERSSSGDRFNPAYYVGLLCSWPMSRWSTDLKHAPPTPTIWRWTNAAMPQSLHEAVESQALPVLRRLSSFDAFASYASEHPSGWRIDNHFPTDVLFNAALGRLDDARLAAAARPYTFENKDIDNLPDPHRQLHERLRALRGHLNADDRKGVARVLHELELINVKAWKLEPYWEPSPFPLELQT